MKKVLALILVLAMAVSLAACAATATTGGSTAAETQAASSAAETSTTSGKRVIKFAYCFANLDENNKRNLDALQARVAEINSERDDIEVEFFYTDSQASVDKQISDVEALIAKDPDIMLISAVDTVGSIPAAQAAAAAGIIVVDDRGMQDNSISYMFQSMDENSIKEMKKQYIIKHLEENPDKVLYFGLIYGMPAQTQQLIRNDDVKELAKEMPDRVIILDERYGNWSTQESMAIVEDWMQVYPEMNAISAASDDMILGAINALSAANKLDGFFTMGVDGTKIGIELVEAGKLTVTVKALMTKMATQCVDIAVKAVEGTFTEKYYTPGTDALVAVDKSNVAEVKSLD